MIKLFILFAFITHFAYTLWTFKKALHILQLNSYRNSRYLRWIQKNYSRIIRARDFLPGVTIPLLWFELSVIASLVWIASYLFLFLTRSDSPEKKKFVVTSRVKRLFATTLLLQVALSAGAFYTLWYANTVFISIAVFAFLTLLSVFSVSIVLMANLIVAPLETAINRWYYHDANKRIKEMPNLTVIGITGSFGKTSTKYILSKILSEQLNVLMTPESYNTPMGITKVIRTSLKPIHEIFIAEMGAKQKGDIKELCNLVSPRLGILTAIGEQHLETFKSLENIKHTKNELVESLPDNGIAFLNWDNEHIRTLLQPAKVKTIYYGIDSTGLHYVAENLQLTSEGNTFTVRKPDGSRFVLQTKLLGKYNIYNILAAVSCACELGVEIEIISYVVKNLVPIPHRLELKRSSNNVTIIDDAFNSNPMGAKMALDVLKNLVGQQKILVTPGMVELGAKEYELNKAFGINATAACDYIILVGQKQTAPICDGLQSQHYAGDKYYIAKDFNDAMQHLQTVAQTGDVVLFENDLPDTYNE
jgi:UDP-N-acetylmuramoyl-tripeptide--D-alanyl-D-alanine ligase